jgi:general stress protein YciG
MQTCRAVTRKGTTCRAAAGPNGLCSLHQDPDRAKLIGSKGGQQNRRTGFELEIPEGSLTNTDLSNLIVMAMRKLVAGEIGARDASALSQLCNSLAKLLPTAALEREVASLQQQLAEMQMGRRNHDFSSSNSESDESGNGGRGADTAEPAPVLVNRGRNGSGNHS